MKKKLLAVLLTGVMTLSLAACGGGGGTTTPAASTETPAETSAEAPADTAGSEAEAEPAAASDDANTLVVWTWDQAFNIYAMKEAEKVYQQDHPEFKLIVQEVLSDDVETKITTAANAGDLSTLPDIFLMQDNSYQKYLSYYPDVFTDLTDSGIDFSQFGAAKTAYSVVDGRNYAVPFDNGAVIAAYRTDMLDAAGLTIDDFTNITWADYLELGKKVKEATGNPLLTAQAGSPDIIMEMLQSAGASMFNEDGSVNIVGNDVLVEAVEIYRDLVAEGVLVEVTDWDQYIASIQNGTVAGTINGCWIIGSITAAEDQSGNWGVTNMPRLVRSANATNYSNNGGSSWAISSNCANPELAIDFLNSTFAGSVEFYETILPSAGALATWLPAGDSDVYQQPQEFFGGQEIYADITDFAGQVPSNITGPFYYDARNAVGTAITNIIQNGADIETELQGAQETVEFNMGG